MNKLILKCRENILDLFSPVIMGILNVTPDSFSDGGAFIEQPVAVDHALRMVEEGAGIIDIGGESTRPGAEPVEPDEQIRRTVPVIRELSRQTHCPISIDTTHGQVAAAALDAGAAIINDISALQFDPKMALLAAREKVPVVLMHIQGRPRTMQQNPTYNNVVEDVKSFLADRIEHALAAGIDRAQIIIDPGIGFGKTIEHNLLLLRHLDAFHELDTPILIGTSRKSFIGKILGHDNAADRLYGSMATMAWALMKGTHILRVHDVKPHRDLIAMLRAITAEKSAQINW